MASLRGGGSLVIAEILSVRSEDRMYCYRVPVARTIIAGDLEKEEVQKPLELFADPWLKEWFDFWGA